MSITYRDNMIFTTVHDFKTNLSRYMRLLERGEYRSVVVKRRDEIVGVYVADPRKIEKVRAAGLFTRNVK